MNNKQNEENLNTESGALQHIVTWSESLPLWQRDALRRLCNKDHLDGNDFEELLAISKGNSSNAMPLKHEDLPSAESAYDTVNLLSISDSENVNALEPGETLNFEKGNSITVVYGDNGSGKSGYARILKSACRARMKDKHKIKPNIYSQNPGLPKASIRFSINKQNHDIRWEQDKECDSSLSAISVFDSSTANVHVDEDNDVAYTPIPTRTIKTPIISL